MVDIKIFVFAQMQILVEQKKTSNLRPKIIYMGLSRLEFEKVLSYLNQHSRIIQVANFCAKIKKN